ncbi:hypothetical protein PLICRDRAFT_421044, partial [Plicaturopsis crispa FD-325 SS-3]
VAEGTIRLVRAEWPFFRRRRRSRFWRGCGFFAVLVVGVVFLFFLRVGGGGCSGAALLNKKIVR